MVSVNGHCFTRFKAATNMQKTRQRVQLQLQTPKGAHVFSQAAYASSNSLASRSMCSAGWQVAYLPMQCRQTLSRFDLVATGCSCNKGGLYSTGVHKKRCRKKYNICTSTIGTFCGGGLPRKGIGTLHASSILLHRWQTNAVRVRRLPLLGKCAAACVGLQGRLKAVGIPHPDSAGLILACGWIQHDPACRQ